MTSLNTLLDAANRHILDGDHERAAAALDAVLDADSGRADALLLRGIIDCRAGRPLEGLQRIAAARALDPDAAIAAAESDRIAAAAAATVAADAENDPVQAARLFHALRAAGMEQPAAPSLPRIIEHLLQRAMGLRQVGRNLEAERELRAALTLAPDHPEALGLLGLIRLADNGHAEAMELLARALPGSRNQAILTPHFEQAMRLTLNSAFYTLQAGKVDRAERMLQRVLAAQPGNVIALTYLATLETQRNRPEAGLEHALAAIELGAKTPVNYRLAALANTQLGQYRDAAAMQTIAGDMETTTRLRNERRDMAALPPPDPSCPDLVLGAGFGYGVQHLEPFIRTLRDVAGYDGDAVMLVTSLTPDMTRFFAEYRIDSIVCDTTTFIPTLPANARLIKYYDVLKQMRLGGRPARRVLLTDVRDVIFQADPFGYDHDEALFYTLYAPDFSVADSPVDLMWFRRAYGDAVADRVASLPLACCGTVLGTGAGILEYVSVFLEHFLGVDQGVRAVQFLDQTIHNYILHHDLVRPARVLENHDAIGTLMLGRRDFTLDADFRVTGLNGKTAGILHGYDRQPDLLAHIRRVYGGV